MKPTLAVHELAAARTDAAAALEQAIAGLGTALRAFALATEVVERRANVADLTRYVETPIVLHLARAGLGAFLDRKLTGAAPGLRHLVESQHRRTPGIGSAA